MAGNVLARSLVQDSTSKHSSLVDWRAPERNAHVLDWRQRAHEFGLVPLVEGVDGGAVDEPIVEPADRLIEEEDPEADLDGREEPAGMFGKRENRPIPRTNHRHEQLPPRKGLSRRREIAAWRPCCVP